MNTDERFEMTDNEAADNRANLLKIVQDLQSQVDDLKKAKKNQRPGVASGTKAYVRLLDAMPSWGKVPRQQEDVAEILIKNMEVDKQYTETEVIAFLVDGCGEYLSLTGSKQDPTYVFRYYRGLKDDGRHAGYIARGFLRML